MKGGGALARRGVAALAALLAACGPEVRRVSPVDLVEVRGLGDPVVLYDVDKAQAAAEAVRAAVETIQTTVAAENLDVRAGERPFVRVSYFTDVAAGPNAFGRALVVFAPEAEGATVFFRPLDAEVWQRGALSAETAKELAEAVGRISGVSLPEAIALSAETLRAVRKAILHIAVKEGLYAEDLRVEKVVPQLFWDASLGCPAPGEAYAQVLSPGYEVHIAAGENGTKYDVRVSGDIVRVCR